MLLHNNIKVSKYLLIGKISLNTKNMNVLFVKTHSSHILLFEMIYTFFGPQISTIYNKFGSVELVRFLTAKNNWLNTVLCFCQ